MIDFGEVDAFTSSELIISIQNTGSGDLNVTEISIAGPVSYSLLAPETPFVLAQNETAFVTVQFSPTSICDGCTFDATVTVKSDDADEGEIAISVVGNGLAGAVDDQASVLETAIDDAIFNGGLEGSGSGGSANGRMGAFANMIEAAGDLVEAGLIEDACGQLRSARRRVDGSPRPPDFVTGTDAELIRSQIDFLMSSIDCS